MPINRKVGEKKGIIFGKSSEKNSDYRCKIEGMVWLFQVQNLLQ